MKAYRNEIDTRSESRSGTGVVELAVALACLMVLASLAMPMLIQLRSTSRKDVCKNRLRQVCLAAHNFGSSRRKLPPATLGYEAVVDRDKWADDVESGVHWKHTQNTSSLLLIAPYMELQEYYNKVHPIGVDMNSQLSDYIDVDTREGFKWQGEIPDMDEIMTVSIGDFLCPEDKLVDESLMAIIATQPCQPFDQTMGSNDACRDIGIQHWPGEEPDEENKLGLTNCVACLGATGQSLDKEHASGKWGGAMPSRTGLRFTDITDGSSNTLMYGETLGEINDGQRSAGQSWIWGGGARVTGHWPLDATEHPDDEDIPVLGNEKYSSGVGFGSRHQGIVNFVYCDGSVHEIGTELDVTVLYKLAGRNDGEIIDEL